MMTSKTEQRYKEALERIQKFGHSNGHGHGYTCANIAEEALKSDKLSEHHDIYNIRQ